MEPLIVLQHRPTVIARNVHFDHVNGGIFATVTVDINQSEYLTYNTTRVLRVFSGGFMTQDTYYLVESNPEPFSERRCFDCGGQDFGKDLNEHRKMVHDTVVTTTIKQRDPKKNSDNCFMRNLTFLQEGNHFTCDGLLLEVVLHGKYGHYVPCEGTLEIVAN